MAVRPEQQQTKKQFASEHLPHYGVLMGGPNQIIWSGIGEFSIGPGLTVLPRRELIEFRSFQCGGRIESVLSEQALNPQYTAIHDLVWAKSEKRIMDKSARDCVADVFATHGREGWAILRSLTGKDFKTADALFSSVLPPDIAQQSLVKVIAYLSELKYPLDDPRFSLREELLKAAQVSLTYFTTFTRALRDEITNSAITGVGLKSLDETSSELFKELELDLPAQAAKKQTVEMGRAIAEAVTSRQPAQISEVRELIAALNRLFSQQQHNNQKAEETDNAATETEAIAA